MTHENFEGAGRVYVPNALRDEIAEAYSRAGWRSSRHASEAAAALGYTISHQTIESFLTGRWATTDRRVIRALIAIHGLDASRLALLAAVPFEDDAWTITLPRRHWRLSPEARERVRLALIATLDAAGDTSEG